MGGVDNQIQRVAIVGAGAMGGMYAAHFAATGFDVGFVANGERADRLRAAELSVNGAPLTVPVWPTGQAADLMIFAVKDRQLSQAIEDASTAVGPRTIIISVMNGLDSERMIAERFGADHVLLAVALGMDADRVGDDFRFRQVGRIVFGRAENDTDNPDADVLAVQQALDRAGLAWVTPADMRYTLWSKFLFNTGINQASAVLDAPYGAFQPDGDARDLMMALINEVLEVAAAEGIGLGQHTVDEWLRVLAGMPPQGRTSMHQDAAAGRPTEVETFAGRVVALGAKHGIPTPYNQTVLWILRRRQTT